jgi:hypothetical protein
MLVRGAGSSNRREMSAAIFTRPTNNTIMLIRVDSMFVSCFAR